MSDTETEEMVGFETFTVREVTVQVEGLTSYSASRQPFDEKDKSETWDDYEARVWKQKCHATSEDDDGEVFIPGAAMKLAIDTAVSNINEKIPGKGNQTYSGVFKMGVAAASDLMLGVKKKDLLSEQVYCHANGKRAPGPRVNRVFPILHRWGGEMTFRVFNDSITPEKFQEFFAKAGLIAGVGRGRPSTGCANGLGRFRPVKFTWATLN
jgi:hypothetical protein